MRRPLLAALLAAAGCSGREFPDTPANLSVPEPPQDSVESVVFLVGDAGYATMQTSPLLLRLRDEVDQWSRNLARTGAVTVLYLGDNVYPVGVRDAGDRRFPEDSAHLQAQLDVMTGEHTRTLRTRAVFIPGNHDWGHMAGAEGRDRLFNQATFIARRARAANLTAELLPRAGGASVAPVDVGRHLRLLLIDSAWWLLEADKAEKQRFMQLMEQELSKTDGRSIVIAAHHPWQSGSSHGGLVPFWKALGLRWFLNRSGTALQDVNSLPYRDLKDQLQRLFERHGPPVLWAGGHDHNLQVLRGDATAEPRFSIVSGAGSKTTQVAPTNSTLFSRDEPGFMRLVAMRNGSIRLYVVSAPENFIRCEGPDAFIVQCREVGQREFRTVYSTRLR